MGELYQRFASIQINDKYFTGLHFAFQVERSLKAEPNQAEIRIWNLSEGSRKSLVKDVYVALEAGYVGDTSTVFKGNLARVDHVRIGPDWVTKIRIGDGEKEIKAAHVSTSFPKGAKPADMIKSLVSTMTGSSKSDAFDVKLSAGNAFAKFKTGDTKGGINEFARGFVAMGSAYDKMVLLGNNLGYDVSIQGKQITFLEQDETLGELDYVFSASSGLVGSPEQVQEKHLKAKVLLNAKISPGMGIVLDSLEFKGRYRVEKMTLTGDTHGSEWFCDLLLKRIS